MSIFARSFSWLHGAFPPSLGGSLLPKHLGEVANLTLDIFGTERFGDLLAEGLSGGVGVQEVAGAQVADGFIRFVPYAHSSTDNGTAINLQMVCRLVIGGTTFNVAVQPLFSTVNGQRNPVERALYVPPLGRLAVMALTVPTGSVFLQYYYVDLPLGEYVRYFS